MTTPRKRLVDPNVTRFYHCISRCVRQALLCGQGAEDRKQWLEDRIELLISCFSISACGFAILDNHLHVLTRLNPGVADAWSNEEVVRRWLKIHPPATLDVDSEKTLQAWIKQVLEDEEKVDEYRRRLENLSWFMKSLKEPLARLANKSDGVRGAFWEKRFQSIAILDEEALLATCAYIDLNPLAAGIETTPETSSHTSIRQRIDHAKIQVNWEDVKASIASSFQGSQAAGNIEQDHWLCPVEDRRELHANSKDDSPAPREGMLAGYSLSSYFLLVDYTSRLYRKEKASVSRELAGIFERLKTTPEVWYQRLKKLLDRTHLFGRYFTTEPERLKELAAKQGRHHLNNLVPLPSSAG
jgi:REP element-mobilizing transposase RayT